MNKYKGTGAGAGEDTFVVVNVNGYDTYYFRLEEVDELIQALEEGKKAASALKVEEK